MPWVRIDDQFPQHPKVAKAGPLGLALQVAGLCYCNRYLTDGYIPNEVLNGLLTGCSTDELHLALGKVVMAGLWKEVDGGLLIHDYLDYQPSRAQIEAERQRNRIAGQRSAERRVKHPVEHSVEHSVEQGVERRVNPSQSQTQSPSQDQAQPEETVAASSSEEIVENSPKHGTGEWLLGLFSEQELFDIKTQYPDHNLLEEAKGCVLWWAESKRPMKKPRTAFTNRMKKAEEFRLEKAARNGEVVDTGTGEIRPDSVTARLGITNRPRMCSCDHNNTAHHRTPQEGLQWCERQDCPCRSFTDKEGAEG